MVGLGVAGTCLIWFDLPDLSGFCCCFCWTFRRSEVGDFSTWGWFRFKFQQVLGAVSENEPASSTGNSTFFELMFWNFPFGAHVVNIWDLHAGEFGWSPIGGLQGWSISAADFECLHAGPGSTMETCIEGHVSHVIHPRWSVFSQVEHWSFHPPGQSFGVFCVLSSLQECMFWRISCWFVFVSAPQTW